MRLVLFWVYCVERCRSLSCVVGCYGLSLTGVICCCLFVVVRCWLLLSDCCELVSVVVC